MCGHECQCLIGNNALTNETLRHVEYTLSFQAITIANRGERKGTYLSKRKMGSRPRCEGPGGEGGVIWQVCLTYSDVL